MADKMTFEIAAHTFAEEVVGGARLIDAYKKAHPRCGKSGNALRVAACEFGKHPTVVAILEDMRREMHERHLAFRDSLVDHLQEEIETCWRENRTLDPVMKQAALAADVLGMKKQIVDLNARVGPIDEGTRTDRLEFLAKKAVEAQKGKGGK